MDRNDYNISNFYQIIIIYVPAFVSPYLRLFYFNTRISKATSDFEGNKQATMKLIEAISCFYVVLLVMNLAQPTLASRGLYSRP